MTRQERRATEKRADLWASVLRDPRYLTFVESVYKRLGPHELGAFMVGQGVALLQDALGEPAAADVILEIARNAQSKVGEQAQKDDKVV